MSRYIITESELRRIISETVSELLSEEININPKNKGKFCN